MPAAEALQRQHVDSVVQAAKAGEAGAPSHNASMLKQILNGGPNSGGGTSSQSNTHAHVHTLPSAGPRTLRRFEDVVVEAGHLGGHFRGHVVQPERTIHLPWR